MIPFRRVILYSVFLLPILTASAAEKFVSGAGSNSNDGSQAAPWQTIAYAIAQSAGTDTIRLERGSLFREGGVNLGGRTLSAYGDPAAPAPVLAGSLVVAGWTADPVRTNVYYADLSSPPAAVKYVYLNGEFLTLARYPNEGWLRNDNAESNRIVDAALASDPLAAPNRWAGGQIRWRKWSWWYETRPITADNGTGTLTLGGSTAGNNVSIDSGYFIENTLAALDAPGEWYWDDSQKRLYLYPPAGLDLASATVEAACLADGLVLGSGAVAQDLTIRHFTGNAVSFSARATLQNSLIEWIGNKGIQGSWGAGNSVIRGNTIRDVFGTGISWNENKSAATQTLMERNVLQRIGTRPGVGPSGIWANNGIAITSGAGRVGSTDGLTIRENRFEGTGYGGIVFNSNGLVAERNIMRDCMKTLNDGASIYCNAGVNYIRDNLILHTAGDLDSSQPWTPLSHGIWVEFLSDFRDSIITGNTVYGSDGSGLFLVNNFNCTIDRNTLFSNRLHALHLGAKAEKPASQEHQMIDNFLVHGATGWRSDTASENLRQWPNVFHSLISYETFSNGSPNVDYGTMSGTVFIHPPGLLSAQTGYGDFQDVPAWQSAESEWADPAPAEIVGQAFLFANDTFEAVDFPLPEGIVWTNWDGTPVTSPIRLNPVASRVLLAASGDLSQYEDLRLYSEIDQPLSEKTVVTHVSFFIKNEYGANLDYPLDPSVSWYHVDGTPAGHRVFIENGQAAVVVAGGGAVDAFRNTKFLTASSSLAMTFAKWGQTQGLSDSADPGTDTNQDGLPDGFNYAFNLPLDGSGAAHGFTLRPGPDPSVCTIRYARPLFATDLSLTLQTATDLNTLNWTSRQDLPPNISPDPLNPWQDLIEVTVPTPGPTPLFARLLLHLN